MKCTVLLPGLGYGALSRNVLRLQPWNYLIQLAEELVREGHEAVVSPVDAVIDEGAAETIGRSGAGIEPLSDAVRSSDVVITPLGVGFLHRVRGLLAASGADVVAALTTPVMPMPDLLRVSVRVWLSRTSSVINSLIKENLGLRLRRRDVCGLVKCVITPSRDFITELSRLLPCSIRWVEYIPRVGVEGWGEGPRERVITYFGPYTEERGVISLIKAFRAVSRDLRDYVLELLIRPGGGHAPGNGLIKGARVRVRIAYLGMDELVAALRRSAAVVLPYRVVASAVPLAYLEALMLEGPLALSTAVPGVRQHVTSYLDSVPGPAYGVRELSNFLLRYLADDSSLTTALKKQRGYVRRLRAEIGAQSLKGCVG